jgi:chromosome segregation ATPase
MRNAAIAFGEKAAEFAMGIGTAADKLRESAAATDLAMRNAALAFSDKTEAAARQLATALSEFRDGLVVVDQRVRETATTVQTAQQALAQTTAALDGATKGLMNLATDMRGSGEALRGILAQMSSAALALQKTADAQQHLQQQAETLSLGLIESAARFTSLDENLARTVEELLRGLNAFQQQIQGFVSQTDAGMAEAADKFMNLIDDFTNALEDFRETPAGQVTRR